MSRHFKASIVAVTIFASMAIAPAAMSDQVKIDYFHDYYITVKRATGGVGEPGFLGIIRGFDKDRGKAQIVVEHPCAPKGKFTSPVFWTNGNHFIYKWVRGDRRILVRGVFRKNYVKGVYKLANPGGKCGTGTVGFKRNMWSPPAQ